MFKAHILVREDTDIGAELANLEQSASKHGVKPIVALSMLRTTEEVLASLKKDDAEAGAYGFAMAVTKHVRTDDYDITLELRRHSDRKPGFLSKLFGR